MLIYHCLNEVVRTRGLEPPRANAHNDLNVARLPVPPRALRFRLWLGVISQSAIVQQMSKHLPPYSTLIGSKSNIALFRSDVPVPYPEAIAWMEQQVAGIATGCAEEALWFLEHPPLYTAGTSAKQSDLLQPNRFPVYDVGRGGEYTYHGPGQRVVYVLIDLNKRGRDLRAYVKQLEQWVIDTLAVDDIHGVIRTGRVGVWVNHSQDSFSPPVEEKIAAIGIRVRKWITFHGIAINVSPNLEHFSGIVPCGLSSFGVTSLTALGKRKTLTGLDADLIDNLPF